MKKNERSKEIELVFILCRLAVAQMKFPLIGRGLSSLFAGQQWKNSTTEEKHYLLQLQYEIDFALATANERIVMEKINKTIMGELANF